MRRRAVIAVVTAVVALAVVGGATAFSVLDKKVSVTVDGKERTVRTFARTVGAVLAQEHIAIGPHDILAPAAGTRLSEGDHVAVRFGRRLVLQVDGQQRELWVTAQSVDAALDQIGVRVNGAYLSASRSLPIGRQGLTLSVRTARRLTVAVDGRRIPVTTTESTVAQVLTQAAVTLRPRDTVSAHLTDYPREAQVLTVTRVDARRVSTTKVLAFRTERRSTTALYAGETALATRGRKGAEVLVYLDTFVDKARRSHALVTRTVTATPVTEVVLVGSRKRPAPRPAPTPPRSSPPASHSPSGDGLNWAALARCESGGNPHAVNPAGYYGLYQFSPSTWRAVGGSGSPSSASSGEQTYRAQLLYRRSGAGNWPVCGRLLFS